MAGLPLRKAPYKDFLQPALQRRFASTALVLLAVSYLEAVLLSGFSSLFWSWFPIGPAGFRALFFFCCGLPILILRIAHYHVGVRTTGSNVQTLYFVLTQLQTYETAFWYLFSSALFCPMYLWAMPESANMWYIYWFTPGRPRLNEKPVFMTVYLGICALMQVAEHYLSDVDYLNLSWAQRRKQQGQDATFSPNEIATKVPRILMATLKRAFGALVAALPVYYLLLRSLAWGQALMILRPFYNLPRTNMLPPTWPTDVFVLLRAFIAGTCLLFLWAAGNTAFSVFMVKVPLKANQPLTSDSKDPNGSLLNGLKSKKLSIKSFAMWELAQISESFEPRRQAIYVDIDRKDGPMWSQVYAICMETIKSIEARIDEFNKPPAPTQAPAAPVVEERHRARGPLTDDGILSPSKPRPKTLGSDIRKAVGDAVYAPGASPVKTLSPMAKKHWGQAKTQFATQEQVLTSKLMQYPLLSAFFGQQSGREITGIVLDRPHAEPTLFCNAAKALGNLAVHSLKEDQYGNVHRDVPSIIRTFSLVILKVESFKKAFPVSNTESSRSRVSHEVDDVLDALRSGLKEVVDAFGPYAHDLRLSQADLRQAKEAIAKPEPTPAPVSAPQPQAAIETKIEQPKFEIRPREERRQESRSRRRRPEMEQVR